MGSMHDGAMISAPTSVSIIPLHLYFQETPLPAGCCRIRATRSVSQSHPPSGPQKEYTQNQTWQAGTEKYASKYTHVAAANATTPPSRDTF